MIAFRRHLFESCKLEVGLALIPMIIIRQLHHPCMSGGLGFVLQALDLFILGSQVRGIQWYSIILLAGWRY